MSLKDRLMADGNAALKSGDRARLTVIRMVRAQMKNAEIAKGRDLTEPEMVDVLVSAAKARREALAYFTQGQRDDLVHEEEQALRVIEDYLPQPLSEAELRTLIDATIHEVGAAGPKDMGRVMSVLMPQVKGRAEGKLVNELVMRTLKEL